MNESQDKTIKLSKSHDPKLARTGTGAAATAGGWQWRRKTKAPVQKGVNLGNGVDGYMLDSHVALTERRGQDVGLSPHGVLLDRGDL